MKDDFVANIRDKIQRFEYNFRAVHGVETIVTGLDMSGFNSETGATFFMPHIYTVFKSVNGDGITCFDSTGFSAVGGGMRHAESQFMLAGHAPFSSMPETLLLTYMAKKRSEIAPGVGKKGTDMFIIGPPPAGPFTMLDKIDDLEMDKIQSIYKSMEGNQKRAFDTAKVKINTHIERLFKTRAEKQEKLRNEQTGSAISELLKDNPDYFSDTDPEPTSDSKQGT
jgi:hypothetical protein